MRFAHHTFVVSLLLLVVQLLLTLAQLLLLVVEQLLWQGCCSWVSHDKNCRLSESLGQCRRLGPEAAELRPGLPAHQPGHRDGEQKKVVRNDLKVRETVRVSQGLLQVRAADPFLR